jgi:hypothetical protein
MMMNVLVQYNHIIISNICQLQHKNIVVTFAERAYLQSLSQKPEKFILRLLLWAPLAGTQFVYRQILPVPTDVNLRNSDFKLTRRSPTVKFRWYYL